MKLSKGLICINKETGVFIQIKEITYYNTMLDIDLKSIACIVCSDECRFSEDSKTTVGRQLLSFNELKSKYALMCEVEE